MAGFCGLLLAAGISRAESFFDLEAVDANGVSTWNGSLPITLVGVLLTDPNEMLDATPDYLPWNSGANAFNLGGQWQVFVQALGGSNRGGRRTCREADPSAGALTFGPRSRGGARPYKRYSAVQPPSIERLAPVICAAASEHR